MLVLGPRTGTNPLLLAARRGLGDGRSVVTYRSLKEVTTCKVFVQDVKDLIVEIAETSDPSNHLLQIL